MATNQKLYDESLEYFKTTPYYDKVETYITEERVYPYIIRNTLWSKVDTKYVFFFDIDDILMPEALEKCYKFQYISHILRFTFYNFWGDTLNYKPSNMMAHGVFWTTQKVFERTGGFLPWKCGADSELLDRCLKNNLILCELNEPLFYRRKHPEALTQHPDTVLHGDLRKGYQHYINEHKNLSSWPLKIETTKTKIIRC